jgi:predicted metal-dependent hydrolase
VLRFLLMTSARRSSAIELRHSMNAMAQKRGTPPEGKAARDMETIWAVVRPDGSLSLRCHESAR